MWRTCGSRKNGPTWLDGDTVASPLSWVARRSAGAALVAVDAVNGKAAEGTATTSSFAIIRPPGHHATADRAMGFVSSATPRSPPAMPARPSELAGSRCSIGDVHHGSGTRGHPLRRPGVLFISFHQWPLYPGSGWLDETGSGRGGASRSTCRCRPVAATGNIEGFRGDRRADPRPVRPGSLIVSAGRDGHVADQLASQNLTAAGYHAWPVPPLILLRARGSGWSPFTRRLQPEHAALLDHGLRRPRRIPGPDRRHPAPELEETGWPERLAQIRRAQSVFWAVWKRKTEPLPTINCFSGWAGFQERQVGPRPTCGKPGP